jgi:PKD repeat protein
MRFSRVFTLAGCAVGCAALLAACGSDSNGPDDNNVAPVADFTFSCSDLACTFTDHSADPDGQISSVQWSFGDGQTATGSPASHTYAQAATYNVTVKATDNGGKSTTSQAKAVTVTAPTSGGPVASFTVTCASLDCTITNTSTATGAATWAWTFGDGQTSSAQDPDPVHYDVDTPTTFTITLVVTDGGQSSQASQQVSVSPAAGLTCENGQACTLLLTERSTVIVTLESHDCEVHGNQFVLTAPINEVLFDDGCYDPVAPDPAASHPLNGGNAFDPGTQLSAEVLSGFSGTTTPQLQVTGDFTNGWTLKYDDGFVGPNEPDFNDLVITVKASPSP